MEEYIFSAQLHEMFYRTASIEHFVPVGLKPTTVAPLHLKDFATEPGKLIYEKVGTRRVELTDGGGFASRKSRSQWVPRFTEHQRVAAVNLPYQMGRRIAELRKACGLTQEKLANRVGIATRHLQTIEGVGVKLPMLTMHAVATALGVSVAELYVEPQSLASSKRGRPKN